MQLVAVAGRTSQDEVGEPVDPDTAPRKHMVDRAAGTQRATAVEAARLERVIQRLTGGRQRKALTAEEVSGDVRNILAQPPVHAPHVLDPQQLERGTQQSGKPSQP